MFSSGTDFLRITSYILFIFLIAGLSINNLMAQQDSDIVQLSGFVITHDSSKVLPYVSVRVNGSNRGTYSDMGGYFSLAVKKSDFIVFTSIGLRPVEYKVPQNVDGYKVNCVIPMSDDTFYLPEAVIHSYPTPEEFDYYFTHAKIPQDQLNIAFQNLKRNTLMMDAIKLSPDGQEAANWQFRQQFEKNYYAGQAQPIKILDYNAWSQFLQSLRKK